jgi:hypothetical protein
MTQLKLALQTQRLFLDFEGRRRYFRFKQIAPELVVQSLADHVLGYVEGSKAAAEPPHSKGSARCMVKKSG